MFPPERRQVSEKVVGRVLVSRRAAIARLEKADFRRVMAVTRRLRPEAVLLVFIGAVPAFAG